MYVTQWFSEWEVPTRVGVYQRLYPVYRTNAIEHCYWDGKKWYAEKYADTKWVSCYQNLKWRGIAQE